MILVQSTKNVVNNVFDGALIQRVILGLLDGRKWLKCTFEKPCTPSPDYWVGLEEQRQEDEREESGFAWRRGEGGEGGAWRREEDQERGGEENGEDYDDCYCEDCVVGGSDTF